jgi:hypothetical protein
MTRPALPRPPLALGLAGLLPFWLLALARVTGLGLGAPPAVVGFALATYAATILSFLGGIRWGLAMSGGRETPGGSAFLLSVLPQLAGWAALALPDPWRCLILGVMILLMGSFDRRLVRQGGAPAWFGRLRLILSLGAGSALFLAGLA